jgi:hypothetical protein
MNERIRQLAEKAGLEYNFDPMLWLKHEKFAELIVEECALISDTERSNSVGCGYITKTNGMRIKEHFGVTE